MAGPVGLAVARQRRCNHRVSVLVRIEDLEVLGVRCPVRIAGRDDARETVVFLHGNPGSSEDWLGLLPSVGELARAIAPDLPGYGRAARPWPFPYDVPSYVEHVRALLEQLGVRRAHWVLHDLGGVWGLAFAAAYPSMVESLTLINIGVLPGYRWHKFARLWRTRWLGELSQLLASRATFGWLVSSENPRPLPRAFIDRMYADMDRGSRRATLAVYRSIADIGALSLECGQKLAPHRLPALVLWGTGDRMLDHELYADAQRRFFDVQAVHRLERCGHWPFIDEPDEVRELILTFLRARIGTGQPGGA
jgi:pimeloyl-ACP methyl ester carboxylesterase